MKIKQTAGREQLGEFASEFAHYNDDILFGENWNNQDIDLKMRSILTVVSLMSMGINDSSLIYHLKNAKKHGVTKREIAAIITHCAFYVGWPKAWAIFPKAIEVWKEDESVLPSDMMFPIGEKNPYNDFFTKQSYLYTLVDEQTKIYNVTFEPGCRNNWHIHHASKGGGQILICHYGKGYYQFFGEPVKTLLPGDCVFIPAGVKHWHGASDDSWFAHLAIEVAGEQTSTQWMEEVVGELNIVE